MKYELLQKRWTQRRELIRKRYRGGRSIKSIATQLRLSYARVHKIVTTKS
jgi:DNA-binding NarL/FixJ family response regulator